jgi:hypothetical protein
MKTEPFRPFLAAIFITALAAAAPALADGQSDGASPAPAAEAKPKKPGKPIQALQGLHLKLGNIELKVRGPVIIDAGPNDTDTSGHGH